MTDLQKSLLMAMRNLGPRAPESATETRALLALAKEGFCMEHEGQYRITPNGERALAEQ